MADSNNYVVGRGKLFFDRFADGALAGPGFRYFGNTPELTTSQSVESLEHYSSDEGMKFKDASVDLSNDMAGSFTCDNISTENLALFFLGAVDAQTIVSAAGVKASKAGTFSAAGTADDTITINGQAITLKASGAAGFQINIGGDVSSTAANLVTLINNNPSTFDVSATHAAGVVTVTALDGGAGGNAITLSESSTAFSWAGAATTLSGGTDNPTETLTDVQLGLYYPLGVSDATPQGLRGLSINSVMIASTPVLAAGNWAFDPTTGLFQVLSDAADINDGDDLIIDYDVAAGTRNMVIGSNKTIYGALRFYSKNPQGRQKDYFWPYVKLSPNGDLNLKGDDWQVVGWNFEVLRLNDAVERVYIDDRAA